MRWPLFVVLAVATSSTSVHAKHLQDGDLSTDKIYAKVLPSIVTLEAPLGDGTYKQGTGFFAIDKGVVVTAYHVLSHAKSCKARFSDGEEFEVEGVIDFDIPHDVALVKVRAYGHPLLSVNSQDPTIGSKACAVGAPNGLEFSVSDGIVSQVQLIDGQKQIQYTAPTSHGNSGGPLINSHAEVIGVVDWGMREGQNLNFAVPMSYVLGMDAHHAVRPWSAVSANSVGEKANAPSNTGDPSSPKISVNAAEFDAELVKALYVACDQEMAIQELLSIGVQNNAYKYGIPTSAYAVDNRRIDEEHILDQTQLDDPMRSAAKSEIQKRLLDLQDALYLAERGVAEALSNNGWNAVAVDHMKQAIAGLQTAQAAPTVKQMIADPAFQKLLSQNYLYLYKIVPDPSGFSLGVTTPLSDPLYIVSLAKDSLADKLHFHALEDIKEFDGRVPKDIFDLKAMIKTATGKKVKIKSVARYSGKRREWEVEVPKSLG